MRRRVRLIQEILKSIRASIERDFTPELRYERYERYILGKKRKEKR